MSDVAQKYAELSAAAEQALATYEAADAAVVAAFGRGARREERQPLIDARDAADQAHVAACDARDAFAAEHDHDLSLLFVGAS